MRFGGRSLVPASPEGPGEDESFGRLRRQEDACEKRADFRDAGDEGFQSFQATISAGLVSFGLV